MKLREATISEMNEVYMMGFDAWSDNMNKESYLESCANSPKYKKGTWWILENNQSELLCSLIVYQFESFNFGIGSIATPVSLRGNGYASDLVSKICTHLEQINKAKAIYLYSDIKPEFYENLGFVKVKKKLQLYSSSTCMIRSSISSDKFKVPKYF
ncbi:GNAT family N-acetyltransferase [Halobacteriovorax sp. HFRX-2_2]|uniref:GNAT family N-acetyltransferase n=1 Tax=unclassified Halobacteriovorax TaxID=2639665 RepID=UPI00371E5A2D